MASRAAVVHIGTHKTGTTSFQAMIARNEEYFAKQGLSYPAAGRIGDTHHNLAWELHGDERYDPAAGSLADLVHELRQVDQRAVLLSSEDFECLYRRPESLRSMRASLQALGYDTHVVVVLRQPSEYLESLYDELHAKHGFEEELATFVARAMGDGNISFRHWDFTIDYERLVAPFAAVFGDQAVHCLRYSRVDSVPPLLEACGTLLGLTISPIVGWPRFNPRTSGDARRARISLTRDEQRAIEASFGPAVRDLVRRYPAPRGDWLKRLHQRARAYGHLIGRWRPVLT
jgi:hypothetical protein